MIFKYLKVLGRYSKYFSDTPILLETHLFDTHTHIHIAMLTGGALWLTIKWHMDF